MAIIKQSLIVLVLLICGAGGSATPAPAPEPALLTQDNLCVGIRSVLAFLEYNSFISERARKK